MAVPGAGFDRTDLDEYPLLNEPNVMLVALRTAAAKPASIQDCLDHLKASLGQAGLELPPEIGPLRHRIEASYRCLEAARLVERGEDGRYSETARGSAVLRAHPKGIDASVLVEFPEFRTFIRQSIGEKDTPDRREPPKEYGEGYMAGLSGGSISDNPYSSDSINHLEWQNGWSEAQDESLDVITANADGALKGILNGPR